LKRSGWIWPPAAFTSAWKCGAQGREHLTYSESLKGLLLTCIAMLAFAANSLLARAALADGGIGAVDFTMIRLAAGAAMLAALMLGQGSRAWIGRGNLLSALCLLGYALGFSLAYLRLGAALGAILLFASVQVSMIGLGIAAGHRPNFFEIAGLAVASIAFVWLMLPGLHAPDPFGAAMMISAGIAWGLYSLRGRGSTQPMADTAGNFLHAAVLCIPVTLAAAWMGQGHALHPANVELAILSGALTSGVGYSVWYLALPHLRPLQAASVQLTVPVIAALGAVVFLGETLSLRLVLAGSAILAGVATTILARRAD